MFIGAAKNNPGLEESGKGDSYTCKTSSTDTRNRWRQ